MNAGFTRHALIAALAAASTLLAIAPASARHDRHGRHYAHHRHYHHHYRRHYVHVGSVEPFGPGAGAVVTHRGGARYFDPRYADPRPFGHYVYRTAYYYR